VNDTCPVCRSALYCETCKDHPKHWPYEKQKIRALIQAVDKECDEKKLEMLEKARNTLMHGGTLKEIEEKLPDPKEEIVDTLGKIVFLALLNQFPRELMVEKAKDLKFLSPSTFIHKTLTGIGHMQMGVPVAADGELDLSFSGTKMEMITDAPPQSARPFVVVMTKGQYEKLTKLSYKAGDHQEMCRRIVGRVHGESETHIGVIVFATDFRRIDEAIKKKEVGEWQALLTEIMGDKGASSGGGS
jgi:hypothetical protein